MRFLPVHPRQRDAVHPAERIDRRSWHDVESTATFILACLARVAARSSSSSSSLRYPGVPPIVTCVVLLLPAVLLSGFFHGNVELIQDTAIEFVKVLVYFLLLIALVDRHCPGCGNSSAGSALFSAAVTLIAVLRYHADVAVARRRPGRSAGNKNVIHGTFVVDKVRDAADRRAWSRSAACAAPASSTTPTTSPSILVTAIPLCLYWLTDPRSEGDAAALARPAAALRLRPDADALARRVPRPDGGPGDAVPLRYGGKKTILLLAWSLCRCCSSFSRAA